MKRRIGGALLCGGVFFFIGTSAQVIETKTEPITIGETKTFHSEILEENRSLNIYLPEGYHPDSAKKYPVIYLLDGSLDEDFIHISGLTQFASFPWIQIIPESIVVGISNNDRKHDFTFPTTVKQDQLDFPTTGGSADFIRFLEEEMIPFVQKHYPVDSSATTLIGQSLGGLLATEILLKKSQLFNTYIIVSPSLWWDDGSLLQVPTPADLTGKSVYISVGNEGKVMKDSAKKLSKKLAASATDNRNIFFQYFPKLDHSNALHLSVYDALEKLVENP